MMNYTLNVMYVPAFNIPMHDLLTIIISCVRRSYFMRLVRPFYYFFLNFIICDARFNNGGYYGIKIINDKICNLTFFTLGVRCSHNIVHRKINLNSQCLDV